ncbi:MAG TPA: ATP-binding protein [Kouleothrix sp.]|uniref:AAA family ATPase n=1 Tax=Kouleothrix sp. TaxID=2779161 RepID=UPI002C872C6F|nr:ATP-binding protein [Kouleothrix sp.]HRC77796.1 ATP-binding protein [Kouleothrix sp.]
MSPPTPATLVVVTGPPATGKTALSRRLASDLRLPLLARDALKEILFDTLGWSDRAWSRRLGATSYELLFHAAELLMRAGGPFILESNFQHEPNSARIAALAQRYSYQPFQIRCYADPAAILERMQRRSGSGERHPGHVEQQELVGLSAAGMVGAMPPLAIGGTRIDLDTSDFTRLDYPALLTALRQALGQ